MSRTTKPRQKRSTADDKVRKQFKPDQHRLVLYNSLPSMPDEFDTKVRTYSNILPTAATASISSVVFTNTLLHGSDDFNPTLAQNASLASIGRNYTKYRVVSYRIDYVAKPRSTTVDCNLTVLHTPNVQAFSGGTTWLGESATRDKAKVHIVPRSTDSPCIVTGSSGYPLMAVIGNPEYQQDDKYVGTIDASGIPTSPTDLTYVYFYTGNVTGTVFTANQSPSYHVMLTQYVRFYDKRI